MTYPGLILSQVIWKNLLRFLSAKSVFTNLLLIYCVTLTYLLSNKMLRMLMSTTLKLKAVKGKLIGIDWSVLAVSLVDLPYYIIKIR